MLDFLNERFLFADDILKEIKRILLIGILFSIFFSFISPLQPEITVFLFLKICLVTILISVLSHVILHKTLVMLNWNLSWTIGKEVIKTVLYFVLIATGLYMALGATGLIEFALFNFFKFIGLTCLYGAIPALLRTMSIQNKRLAKQLRNLSNTLPKDLAQEINLKSPVKSDSFSCDLATLLYLKSDENYIIAVEKDRKTHIRLTMKSTMEQLEGLPFQRVHRSYLVNGQHVTKVGATYLLLSENIRIPISRQFRKEFVEKEISKFTV
jgi:hypothetical protein